MNLDVSFMEHIEKYGFAGYLSLAVFSTTVILFGKASARLIEIYLRSRVGSQILSTPWKKRIKVLILFSPAIFFGLAASISGCAFFSIREATRSQMYKAQEILGYKWRAEHILCGFADKFEVNVDTGKLSRSFGDQVFFYYTIENVGDNFVQVRSDLNNNVVIFKREGDLILEDTLGGKERVLKRC